ncbi:cell envelope biogenesis protein OmpA [Photobacterium jeanii]|uniref:Cell envelope biogenesis protein OmpA n=1 Tax=Photobacterium jeanii TaxID=858640 RepID=A0A178K311_9GAMM|nr:sortase-associated OmpA-like protein PdsO [Photobacterium jeanii]OAN11487.1 cell envelope biogenesis protein OmpA [Photobacterium jeanii]PST91008.1 cell envelope biogenesis protein OmpA [Photobacterium jeanii]
MKKQLISTLIAATIATSTFAPMANASETKDEYKVGQQEQLIGAGSGAAVGVLVGGPAGAVVGAIFGGIIGTTVGQQDYIKAQDQEVSELAARNTELEKVSQRYNQAQIEMARLKQAYDNQRTLDLALEMNVHFRTGSAAIEPQFQRQLDDIAELMKQAPDVNWQLAGYADRRGDSQKNLALSMKRVDAVRDYLESRGVESDQFVVEAMGDQYPQKAEQNFEGDFFDRRVTLRSQQEDTRTAQF